jgi:uncharacterized membrane protein YbhN (UPF0104 family)
LRNRVIFVLLLTLVFLGLVISKIDFEAVRVSLGGVRWLHMAPVVFLYLSTHIARSIRLQALFAQPLTLRAVFSINGVGFLAINTIPARLGELVRPYLLKEKHDVPWGASVAAILVERILDFAMLLFLLLSVSFLVDLPSHGIQVGGSEVDIVSLGQKLAGTFLALGFIGGGFAVLASQRVAAWLRSWRRMAGLAGFGATLVERFDEALRWLWRNPSKAVIAILGTLFVWGTTLLAVSLVLSSFPEVAVDWRIVLVTFIPTAGFFGVYEACCAGALMLQGVDEGPAMACAVVLHLGQFAYLATVGLICLAVEGISLRSAVSGSWGAIEEER